jgi:hypothetical protein
MYPLGIIFIFAFAFAYPTASIVAHYIKKFWVCLASGIAMFALVTIEMYFSLNTLLNITGIALFIAVLISSPRLFRKK